MYLPQEILRKKRDREELSDSEIRQFVFGVTNGTVNKEQIGAFTMGTFLNGMTISEQVSLTLAMRDSGTVLNWDSLPPGTRAIEKHSSGGVGDEKVTLIVAPLVAACGVFSPNISGRSLGHTGGELDLLESIPGYTIQPSMQQFAATVKKIGTAIIGPTPDLAPADRAIFHVRDVTATVESIPLIVSSILSKKLASGAHGLVMTVPFGTGAFMRQEDDAVRLATALIKVAKAAALPMVALISDLNQVLGDSVGNALQILEVIDFLNGKHQEARLREVVLSISSEILLLAGIALTSEAARERIEAQLASGAALLKFGAMVQSLGGPADLTEHPRLYLDQAEIVAPVYPIGQGHIQEMNCWEIGMALVTIGAGRAHPEDRIDYAVGISGVAHVGDLVGAAKPLCLLHARHPEQWETAAAKIRNAFALASSTPSFRHVLRERFVST